TLRYRMSPLSHAFHQGPTLGWCVGTGTQQKAGFLRSGAADKPSDKLSMPLHRGARQKDRPMTHPHGEPSGVAAATGEARLDQGDKTASRTTNADVMRGVGQYLCCRQQGK